MLEISRKVKLTTVVVHPSELSDPAASLEVTLPRRSKKVTVSLDSETDRTATQVADQIAGEVEPDARLGDVLVYSGRAIEHESMDGVSFSDLTIDETIPLSDNAPAAISGTLGAIAAKLT